MNNTNRAVRVYELPPSLRFPPLREGNRVGRVGSVPPACRGNLKEGGHQLLFFCELWLGDWYKKPLCTACPPNRCLRKECLQWITVDEVLAAVGKLVNK